MRSTLVTFLELMLTILARSEGVVLVLKWVVEGVDPSARPDVTGTLGGGCKEKRSYGTRE